ncbi:MAG: hypothetical protein ACRELF_15210, partial [Gemmataceae bacterium]
MSLFKREPACGPVEEAEVRRALEESGWRFTRQRAVMAAHLAAVAVQAARRTILGESAADVVSSRTLEICTGVMQAMSASKPKLVLAVLLMGCLAGTSSWTVLRALPQAPREQHAENADKPVSANTEQKPVTWQECARLRNVIGEVYFAPDGSALAAMIGEDRLCVRNTSNWEQRWQYDLRRRYGNRRFLLREPFSPDGRLIHIVGQAWDT